MNKARKKKIIEQHAEKLHGLLECCLDYVEGALLKDINKELTTIEKEIEGDLSFLDFKQALNGGLYRDIPQQLRDYSYSGCGNGYILVNKETGKIIEMSYSDNGHTIERKQNVAMADDAGDIIWENDEVMAIRANFSSGQVCLF